MKSISQKITASLAKAMTEYGITQEYISTRSKEVKLNNGKGYSQPYISRIFSRSDNSFNLNIIELVLEEVTIAKELQSEKKKAHEKKMKEIKEAAEALAA